MGWSEHLSSRLSCRLLWKSMTSHRAQPKDQRVHSLVHSAHSPGPSHTLGTVVGMRYSWAGNGQSHCPCSWHYMGETGSEENRFVNI